MPPEKDNIREAPQKRRKLPKVDVRQPKQPASDLTCNEEDVDDLLSTGELT